MSVGLKGYDKEMYNFFGNLRHKGKHFHPLQLNVFLS